MNPSRKTRNLMKFCCFSFVVWADCRLCPEFHMTDYKTYYSIQKLADCFRSIVLDICGILQHEYITNPSILIDLYRLE